MTKSERERERASTCRAHSFRRGGRRRESTYESLLSIMEWSGVDWKSTVSQVIPLSASHNYVGMRGRFAGRTQEARRDKKREMGKGEGRGGPPLV